MLLHYNPSSFFFFNDTATTEIYTLSLHDALPIFPRPAVERGELVPLLARFQPPAYAFHLAYPPNRYVSNRLACSSTGPLSSSQDWRSSCCQSSARARHVCLDPRFQCLEELRVAQRRHRAGGAWIPRPQHERIHLRVLDHFLTGATAAVTLRILHLLADLRLGLAFPQHGETREAPGGHARHESVRGVRRLVASLTGLRGR